MPRNPISIRHGATAGTGRHAVLAPTLAEGRSVVRLVHHAGEGPTLQLRPLGLLEHGEGARRCRALCAGVCVEVLREAGRPLCAAEVWRAAGPTLRAWTVARVSHALRRLTASGQLVCLRWGGQPFYAIRD
jgi:hypothetical protein